MQVKKFEAKSMKEALELVKKHLGPEAIILSAKDNTRGFGLMGQHSVEVTAAVSESTLRKKKMAESKLSPHSLSRYEGAPARTQREFIQKATTARTSILPRPSPKARYIDIHDDSGADAISHRPQAAPPVLAKQRVKSAASRALEALEAGAIGPDSRRQEMVRDNNQIEELKAEILRLKEVIESFQKVPQSIIGLHPGAEEGIHYELSGTYQKLLRSGLSMDNAVEILRKAQETLPREQLKRSAFVEAWAAKYILDHTDIAQRRTEDRVHIFMGPSGQGKTASLVKLASHMAICEKKKIAIVTADTGKLGAPEQLRLFAQILNVPFAVVKSHSDWSSLEPQLLGVQHILVDFPGVQLKSISEVDHLRSLLPSVSGGRSIHYVQSVLAKDESAFECAGRFQVLGFTDVIFTGLDEASQHGLIYNFQKKFKVPIHSFGVGSSIPEDFEPATKERVVDLIFKLSKLKKEKTA